MRKLIFVFVLYSASLASQSWSPFLDPSRAIDWTSAGFTIPSYTVNCATQPTLLAGSGNAAVNATAIQNALASCDATHNVVNLPSGTYSIAGITFPAHGKQVLRGAGPHSTFLLSTAQAGCEGFGAGICMIDATPIYNGSTEVLPGGTQQCLWTAGYAQGTTSITLNTCGGTPPAAGNILLLDQANDSADTGGVYICDETTPASCNYDGTGGSVGRTISGVTHSEVQAVKITAISGSGTGPYTVTISPGIYFTNIRSGQTPGAWWPTITQLNGLENLSIDGTADSNWTLGMYDCLNCWTKNVTFLNGGRGSVGIRQGLNNVVRDSYFYGAQGHASVSYNIDLNMTSGNLIENNIMQQTAYPITINNGTGNVVDYNFGADNFNNFSGSLYQSPGFTSHGAGTTFNLFEGNNWGGQQADDAWGSTSQDTYFRNFLTGWMNGTVNNNLRTPIVHRSYVRAMNIVGNVLGQPGQSTTYEIFATGNTTVSGTNEDQSIYVLGLALTGACGNGTAPIPASTRTSANTPFCDTLTRSTLMRWGNYDVVTSGTKFDSTEASPGAVSFVAANFTSTYFNTLAHTLPASLYYASKPSWWPSAKAWPPIGPDVSGGNLGTCTGTFAGSQAISGTQCTGGTLTTAWASHATSIPAQDCFLNVMNGPPDGTGSVLAFDNASCASAPPPSGPPPPISIIVLQ